MPTTADLASRARPTLALVVGALASLAVVVGIAQPAGASGIAAALAAAAVATVALGIAVRALTAAPASRLLHVGHRARTHRESLDTVAEPAHPGTAGRVRSRAPGGVAPAG